MVQVLEREEEELKPFNDVAEDAKKRATAIAFNEALAGYMQKLEQQSYVELAPPPEAADFRRVRPEDMPLPEAPASDTTAQDATRPAPAPAGSPAPPDIVPPPDRLHRRPLTMPRPSPTPPPSATPLHPSSAQHSRRPRSFPFASPPAAPEAVFSPHPTADAGEGRGRGLLARDVWSGASASPRAGESDGAPRKPKRAPPPTAVESELIPGQEPPPPARPRLDRPPPAHRPETPEPPSATPARPPPGRPWPKVENCGQKWKPVLPWAAITSRVDG